MARGTPREDSIRSQVRSAPVSGKDDEIVIVETKYGGRTAPCCRRKGATIFQRASCEDSAAARGN
jgi:hypothetical protein